MSSSTEMTYYMELQPGDAIQNGDQWMDSFGQWQPYVCAGHISGVVFAGVKARRPIGTSRQTAYEEVPGSRTTQQAIDQPQCERIAYEELQPGDVIQEGDEWQNDDSRWHPLVLTPGASGQVRDGLRARRPHKISATLEIGDALTALKSTQRARDELQLQVDELRAERERLQGLIDNLLDEPTAKQVRDMLRTWAIELDWSADCFDSVSREQIDTIQKTLIAVIERIEWLCSEDSDDN